MGSSFGTGCERGEVEWGGAGGVGSRVGWAWAGTVGWGGVWGAMRR
jgi:hypothetical protein